MRDTKSAHRILVEKTVEKRQFQDRGIGVVPLLWAFGTGFEDGWIDGIHFQTRDQ